MERGPRLFLLIKKRSLELNSNVTKRKVPILQQISFYLTGNSYKHCFALQLHRAVLSVMRKQRKNIVVQLSSS